MKVLISTLGLKHQHIIDSFKIFGGNKLIVLHGELNSSNIEAIKTIKKVIPESFIPSEFVMVKQYDISEASKVIRNLIVREFEEGNDLYVNVTGGRKTLAFAAQLASYIENDKVKRLFYVIEETHELMDLPIIKWRISDSKQKILGLFAMGNAEPKIIADRMKISDSMAYKHVKELIEDGYIVKNADILELTIIGKMMANKKLL